jgi:hypothetical protein
MSTAAADLEQLLAPAMLVPVLPLVPARRLIPDLDLVPANPPLPSRRLVPSFNRSPLSGLPHTLTASSERGPDERSDIRVVSVRAVPHVASLMPVPCFSLLRPDRAAQRRDQMVTCGGIVVARGYGTPHRFRPRRIAAAARDDMDVKLGDHVAERGDVELVAR